MQHAEIIHKWEFFGFFSRCSNGHPCVDGFYSVSNDFSELCLRTITSVEVSTWTGGCASGNCKIRTQYSVV